MTYSRTIRPANRLGTLAAVGALHVAAFYAVISGLAVVFVPHDDPPPFSAANHPLPKLPPVHKPPSHHARQPLPDPLPQPTQTTEVFIPLGPAGGPAAGGDTRPTDPPLPPLRPNPPLFTPKAARPLGQPGTWVGESDYPTGELRLGHAGAVGFSLTIGSAGQVTGCTVTRSSGYPALDETTCRLLARRARFEPARDEQGLPAAGAYASTVRWQIPD